MPDSTQPRVRKPDQRQTRRSISSQQPVGASRGPRIGVFGIFGRSNLGNEATLAAFLDNVRTRFPQADVICIAPDVSEVTRMHGLPLLAMDPLPLARRMWRVMRLPLGRPVTEVVQYVAEPWRARRARLAVRDFDALVIPGTGVLDDFGQGPLDLPYHLLRWCRAAARAGIPIHFLSLGAEPVNGRFTRRILRAATQLATYRSYRDEESKTNARALGISVETDGVYPDLAFGLSRDRLPVGRPASSPPKHVGLGVMGYYGWNAPRAEGERIYQKYLAKIRAFVAWLLEHGHSVRLLVGDTSADARPVRDIAESFPRSNGTVIAEPIRGYEDLLGQIAQTDLVVATRLHNVLLSLLLERPVISLSYSPKNDAAMVAVGLGEFTRDVQDFERDWLIRSFQKLARDGGSWIEQMRGYNATFRRSLEEQYDRVLVESQFPVSEPQ